MGRHWYERSNPLSTYAKPRRTSEQNVKCTQSPGISPNVQLKSVHESAMAGGVSGIVDFTSIASWPVSRRGTLLRPIAIGLRICRERLSAVVAVSPPVVGALAVFLFEGCGERGGAAVAGFCRDCGDGSGCGPQGVGGPGEAEASLISAGGQSGPVCEPLRERGS